MNAFNLEAMKLGLMGVTITVSSGMLCLIIPRMKTDLYFLFIRTKI